MNSRAVFSYNLKKLMKEKSIKAAQICKDLEIKQNTFSNWYNGIIFPRVEYLDLLSEYLGVQTYELLVPNTISHEETIGDRIKKLRTKMHLSLDKMTEEINLRYGTNLSKGNISRWENNQNDPNIRMVRILSLYFNVSADYLVGLTDIH